MTGSEHYVKADRLVTEAIRMDTLTRVYAFKGPRQIQRALLALDDAIPRCKGEEKAFLEARREGLRERVKGSERLRVQVAKWAKVLPGQKVALRLPSLLGGGYVFRSSEKPQGPWPKFDPDEDIELSLDFAGWEKRMARPRSQRFQKQIEEYIAAALPPIPKRD